MSQWTVLLLHLEPGVEYLLQAAALHRCLPGLNAARGAADWRVLLCLYINQILTRQNLLRPLPQACPYGTAFVTMHSW